MHKRRTFFLITYVFALCSSLLAASPYPIGEKIVYTIYWGLIPCGESSISCDKAMLDGKEMIRLQAIAKSNWLVSSVYPVNDIINCYIDPETQQSVRLEKHTVEGDLECNDLLVLDREGNRAYWTSESANISTNYPIPAGVCDAVSFLYSFRTNTFLQGEVHDYEIVVDGKVHGISAVADKTKKKKTDLFGKVVCQSFRVRPYEEGLFVRKIPKEIWVTADPRKIMVQVTANVPVGKVRMKLDEYIPPNK